MPFQVYEKGSAPAPTVPAVTIQKRGLISLNLAAVYMLAGGEDREIPKGVELLYDPERKVIGLRPAPLEGPNTYPLRAQAGNEKKGPFLVAGTLFTKFIGLDTTEARRWTPKLEDEVLCVDLNAPSAKATGPRKKATAEPEGAASG
jgi:hypothetical protein